MPGGDMLDRPSSERGRQEAAKYNGTRVLSGEATELARMMMAAETVEKNSGCWTEPRSGAWRFS